MDSLEQRILGAVDDIVDISTLVLFGSRAAGKARPDSDLDIAVLPAANDADSESESRRRWRLQTRVAGTLADLSPEGRVDVVLLDEAPAALRQRILTDGRLLLCRDPDAWRALRVRTMREFGDREWARRLYRRALRRRLTEGRLRGRPVDADQPPERA